LSAEFGIQESGPNAFPSQLFNAMISPMIKNNIKGAIWYQGESNTSEAGRYKVLFAEMINDWRKKWGYDFPFFWAQLANFMSADSMPVESDWAELREAQSKTLSLQKTGQAVIIDIGEAEDIHPKNKQDVGYRLALAALKVAYDKNLVYSGPVYKSMKKEGEKLILEFDETGSGLTAKDKYSYLKGFSIAGNDKKFYWAEAKITDGKITVWKQGLLNPEAVRYAWGNNPDDANLYNMEGLPASPFRTDDWPGITQKY
jgi:sialate O-acetylesterase